MSIRRRYIPCSRTTFTTHELLDNTGDTIRVTDDITCPVVKNILQGKDYDTNMICEELESLHPCKIDGVFLHDARTGVMFIKKQDSDKGLCFYRYMLKYVSIHTYILSNI